MRTSLNNIQTIDGYLFGKLAMGEKLLLDAKILLSSDLADDVQHQQKTYALVQQYSRRQLKAEIASVQVKLASEPQYQTLMQRISNFFKKK